MKSQSEDITRRRRRIQRVSAWIERVITAARAWWRRAWLPIIGALLGMVVATVVKVAIDIGSRPVGGTNGLIRQMTMFVAVINATIAYPVALATMYYARRSGQLTDLEQRRTVQATLEHRRGVVLALVGAAKEAAGYAG